MRLLMSIIYSFVYGEMAMIIALLILRQWMYGGKVQQFSWEMDSSIDFTPMLT